jgi:glutamate dehydrogenase (NADP+)
MGLSGAHKNTNTNNFKVHMPTTKTNTDTAIDTMDFLNDLRSKYGHQPTFLQSVEEMAVSLEPFFSDPEKGDFYKRAFVMMAEPERSISFRVPWMDDTGEMRFNRGWRVEFNS